MRAVVAVVAGAVVGVVAAVIAGEYEMVGATAFLVGGIFAVAISETVASIARSDDLFLAGAVALLTEAALVWGLWIATSHRFDLAPVEAWVSIAAAVLLSAWWFRNAGRRGGRIRRTP